MTDVTVYPPNGGEPEVHTPVNARDLVRNAGWSYDPPKVAPDAPAPAASEQPKTAPATAPAPAEPKAPENDGAGDAGASNGTADQGEASDAGETAGETETGSASEPTALTKADLNKKTQSELRELAAKHGVEIDNRWGRAKLIEAVFEAMTKAN